MKTTPILFSGPMVRAIMEGRKTQTRRVISPQPYYHARDGLLSDGWGWKHSKGSMEAWAEDRIGSQMIKYAPFGTVGDRLWVRETWQHIPAARPSGYFTNPKLIGKNYWYRASDCLPTWGGSKWRPAIFMPKDACRITLEIVSVKVERLQDITQEGAKAEGFPIPGGVPGRIIVTELDGTVKKSKVTIHDFDPLTGFRRIWEALNGKKSPWERNDWVWVYEFKPIAT